MRRTDVQIVEEINIEIQEMSERCLVLIDENKGLKKLIERLEAAIHFHNATSNRINLIDLGKLKEGL